MLGRTARVYWRNLPAERKILIRKTVLLHKKKFLYSGVVCGGGLLYAVESHMQECPVTGRKR